MKIKLRKFSLQDLDRVMAIEKASFRNREAWSKSYFKELHQLHPDEFIVAETPKKSKLPTGQAKKEVIGYTIGSIKKNLAEIISLAVDPDWRRKGVGKALTSFIINHFKKKNIKEVFLRVRTKNKEGVAFYKNLDFKILKIIKKYYPNGDDAYWMGKKI